MCCADDQRYKEGLFSHLFFATTKLLQFIIGEETTYDFSQTSNPEREPVIMPYVIYSIEQASYFKLTSEIARFPRLSNTYTLDAITFNTGGDVSSIAHLGESKKKYPCDDCKATKKWIQQDGKWVKA